MKVECSKEVSAQDKAVFSLNADTEKYLNYETSANGDLIGNMLGRCHDSEA